MKYRKKNWKCGFFLFGLIIFSCILFFIAEERIFLKLQEISHLQCKSVANQVINDSVEVVMKEMNLSEKVLISSDPIKDGYMINTYFVNLFCVRLSEEITNKMKNIPNEKISIPFGAIIDVSILANKGPQIPFSLMPAGAANVDYVSDFSSIGINQVHYKIWLQIDVEMKIVNPVYQEKVVMERKIMLADVVFSGKVPDHFFQIGSTGEYLLTE